MHEPVRDSVFAWYSPKAARGRSLISVALAGSTLAALQSFSWTTRVVAAWDAYALVLLALMWRIITRSSPVETRRRAGSEDPGRTVLGVVVIASSTLSLFAATVVLRKARALAPEASGILVGLSLTAVATAWLLTHTTYALRYARLYYRDDDEGVGGLEFPGNRPPCDSDFAYYAFTIGMCFQVSDVTISSYVIRRNTLVHALISFAYNTAILATAMNLAVGVLG